MSNNPPHILRLAAICLWLAFSGMWANLAAQNQPAETSGGGGGANTSLTLEECLEYAKNNNTQLKQLGLQAKAANANLKQSRYEFYPSANANALQGLSLGRRIDPVANTFSTDLAHYTQFSLAGNYIIYNGGVRKNTKLQRELEYELAQLNIADYANNLDLSVLSAYMQVLLTHEQGRVLGVQSELTNEQYARTQKLIDAGALPAGELLNLDAQVANDGLNKVNVENALRSAYLNLGQLLNLYDSLVVSMPDVKPPTSTELGRLSLADALEDAYATQPQLQSAQKGIAVAEMQHKVAQGGRLPVLSLSANISTLASSLARRYVTDENGNRIVEGVDTTSFPPFPIPVYRQERTPFFGQFGENAGGSVGLNLSIPIFNNHRVKTGIEQAEINIRNSRYAYELARENLRKAVELAFLDVKAAATKYDAMQTSVSALEKSLEHTQKKLDTGTATSYDYMLAKNNLTQAQLNLSAAKYEYVFKWKVLDFYRGKALTL